MPNDQPYLPRPGIDEQMVVVEMLRNQHSPHWGECRNFVKRRVYAKAKDTSDSLCEDIIQEVMLRVWKYLPHFRFECTLKTWLAPIIDHCIVDVHRKPQNEVSYHFHFAISPSESDYEGEEPGTGEEKSAEEIFIIDDEIDEGWAACLEYARTHANPIRNHLIIVMVIREGHSHAEAAEAAGCSPAVVGFVVREAQKYARKKTEHWE